MFLNLPYHFSFVALSLSQVFTMGLLELVILPIWVGIAADLFSLPLLGSTLEARVAWAAGNPFSSLALHW